MVKIERNTFCSKFCSSKGESHLLLGLPKWPNPTKIRTLENPKIVESYFHQYQSTRNRELFSKKKVLTLDEAQKTIKLDRFEICEQI